jgi:hypothetical protein
MVVEGLSCAVDTEGRVEREGVARRVRLIPAHFGTAEVGAARLGIRHHAGDMLVIAFVVRHGKAGSGEIRPTVSARAVRPAIAARLRIERFICPPFV